MALRIGRPLLLTLLLVQLMKVFKNALNAVVLAVDEACGCRVGTLLLLVFAMNVLVASQDHMLGFLLHLFRRQDHRLPTPNSRESNRTL